MALYPEAQKKGQAEIDAVVGPNRLPNFEDSPSLPYVNAMVKELKRWHMVLPLGKIFLLSWLTPLLTISKVFLTWPLATMSTMVTIFQKGHLCLVMHGEYERLFLLSVLTFLFRSILHDPKVFKKPLEYQPERYLNNPDLLDPNTVSFGYGRRSVYSTHSGMHVS